VVEGDFRRARCSGIKATACRLGKPPAQGWVMPEQFRTLANIEEISNAELMFPRSRALCDAVGYIQIWIVER
jgi:hypothetical protein